MRVALAWAGVLGAIAASVQAQDAPGPAGSLMIFFDWGKPEIRSDDRGTLDAAAARYRLHPGAGITLTGHTDRSGSAAANHRTGLRRAMAARAELERRGIPAAAIRIASAGEQQPLFATEDGVREVQNRRVEIRFDQQSE